MRNSRFLICALAAAAVTPAAVAAQIPQQAVQAEARADLLLSRWTSAHAGAGVTFPAGIYVRYGLVAGIGGGARGEESRADFVLRFSLDPFRESRWAPYGGGGISQRFVRGQADRAYMLVFAGVEGPLLGRSPGWEPALELGLGGGTRVSVVLRRAIRGRR